jgi:hypothetical protein
MKLSTCERMKEHYEIYNYEVILHKSNKRCQHELEIRTNKSFLNDDDLENLFPQDAPRYTSSLYHNTKYGIVVRVG